ncbi:MAG: ThuA domain-containing protein [Sedimentisphaerales bacterium]|nr:ThuA domain-containing protein [Sedimentisphaerales bacterium]
MHKDLNNITRRRFLAASAGAIAASHLLLRPAYPRQISDDEKAKVAAAIPEKSFATPQKKRRLLIFDLNVGYGGHASIPTANYAFKLMGEKTGAFDTVVSSDPNVFSPDPLKTFDAVFFNNNVGNLFTDPELRRSLVEFVYAGGGLMGVHGTTVAFTKWPGAIEDWPEFARIIGARGANHLDPDEHVFIKLDDPDSPVTRPLPSAGFEYRDEFFRYHEVYSRNKLRVLLSIDTEKTKTQGQPRGNVTRPDNDYALAWIRNYGRGRVFHSTIAHNPSVFYDPMMLKFYLAAVQFVLGDLPAPTIPSAKLTPAITARENLGWKLGIEAYTFHKYTFFEAIEKTAALSLPYMGGLSFQKVAADIPKNFEPGLTEDELRRIRFKLDDAGIRLLTYYYHQVPGDHEGCKRIFDFARKIGIETIMSEPLPRDLDTIEKFCDQYDINLAIHNHDQKASPIYWRPEGILEVCKGRSSRIGACADLGYWIRAGIDPIKAIKTLGKRLITIQMHDLSDRTPNAHDVPWGTGAAETEKVVTEIRRLGIAPTMFGLEYSYNWFDSVPDIKKCIDFFDRISIKLATRG